MKVAFDTSFLQTINKQRGVGVYLSNLLRSFILGDYPMEIFSYNITEWGSIEDEFLKLIKPDTKIKFKTNFISHFKRRLAVLFDMLKINSGKVGSKDIDIYHQTVLDHKIINSKYYITTIYDLIPLIIKGPYLDKNRKMYFKRLNRMILDSDRIIAISSATKNNIIKFFNVPSEKIEVVHLGVSEQFSPGYDDIELQNVKKKFRINYGFLFYIGSFFDYDPRKNIEFIIQAYYELITKNKIKNILLVLSGRKGKYYYKLKEYLNKFPNIIDKVIFTGEVTEKEKKILYNGAEIFLFPSLYEGFGLPVLEAQACGTPVIASDRGSLHEIINNSAIIINPEDIDGFCTEIIRLLEDNLERDQLIKKGIANCKKFTWDKCAEKTYNIYRSLMS